MKMNYRQVVFEGLTWVAIAAFLAAGTSCTSLKSEVQQSEMDAVDQSMALPEENITVYDDALQKLGVMLAAYNVEPVKLYCRPIVNATSNRKKVPADVSQLTQTALIKIGPKIQSIDFDRAQLAVDLAREETTLERVVPDLAIKGAITEYDKKMEKQREIEGDTLQEFMGEEFDLGGSMDTEASSATIAMDYQLLEYKTQTTIPYVQAANRMNLASTIKGGDFGVAVEGSGFGINCKVKRNQGIHAGLRLLVELSILEVIGKYHNVPYWRCLPGGQADAHMVQRFEQGLKRDPDVLKKMKTYAYAHGREMDLYSGGLNAEEIKNLQELKVEYGLDPEGENDYELIKRMWLNLPYEAAADRMTDVPSEEEIQQAALEAQRQAQLRAAQEAELARQAAEAEAAQKRTTFKFGKQEDF